MEITKEELLELLNGATRETYTFDQNTTFIKEQHITVESGANFYNGSQPKPERKERTPDEKKLILQLMPICNDNENYAREFLDAISGKNAKEITDMVKSFRTNGKMSAELCHHNLWKVLSDNNIYKLTERNWNDRIKY